MNTPSTCARGLLALALAAIPPGAEAAIFRVGPGCTYASVQAAVNATPSTGTHDVHIANSVEFVGQAIVIDGKKLALRGGFDTCSDTFPGATKTTLSGQGGANDSVLTIRGTGAQVALVDLNIIRGDEVHDGYGGGIDFRGAGILLLTRTAVSQNYAGYGGGISMIGEGGTAELQLQAGAVILLNRAQFSGGGIRLEGTANLRMHGLDSTIANNEALGYDPVAAVDRYGYGGGIEVIAPATAVISSPGVGNGAIVANTARYGGGIAVVGADGEDVDGKVTLYSTDPNRPVRLFGNRARSTGGGLFLGVDTGIVATSRGLLCAYDARIDANVAADGSAIYADAHFGAVSGFGTYAYFNVDSGYPAFCSKPPGGVRCTAGSDCNTMHGNRNEDASGNATQGATILVQNKGGFDASRVSLTDGRGAHVLRAFEAGITLDNVAVAANTTSGVLIRLEDESALHLVDATLAGNAVAASTVLSVNGDVDLLRTILWQPGKVSLAQSAGTVTVAQVIASEAASLGAGASLRSPRLVDPARGDVRLRAASPAIDFAPALVGDDVDATGLPRDRRLPPVPRDDGFVRDIGAHERQSLAPILLNGDFDADLNLWTQVTAGTATHDASQNATAAAGSGSTRVSLANTGIGQVVQGLTQCVHLPGPGTYTLSGWGRGTGNLTVAGDIAQLHWELRGNGGDACTDGLPVDSGYLFLSSQASWRRPANPVVIEIPATLWTTGTSITVTQMVTENSVAGPPRTATGWFDGITLEWIDPNDRIFDDGFDPSPP